MRAQRIARRRTPARQQHRLRRDALVHVVVGNLPPAAHDTARRDVEPRAAARHLHLLTARQPIAFAHQPVLERHHQCLDALVEYRSAREGHRETHHGGGFAIEIHRPDRSRQRTIARTEFHFIHKDVAARQTNAHRAPRGVLVQLWRVGTKRMRHIAHVLPVAEADAIGQVVQHDPVAVAIVPHIGGQQRGVATPHETLGTAPRLPPGDLQRQLFALHHARRNHHALTKLREERQKPVGIGAVAQQRAVGQLQSTARNRARHERVGRRITPRAGAHAVRLRIGGRLTTRDGKRGTGQQRQRHRCRKKPDAHQGVGTRGQGSSNGQPRGKGPAGGGRAIPP